MNSTPNGNRKHISIFGKTNSGKSSLVNAFLGQQVSLVSETAGTTTDPVQKAMELIPVGPILLIDTAGFGDESELGGLRIKRTIDIIKRTDIGIYIFDCKDIDLNHYNSTKKYFKTYNIPHLVVINKVDDLEERERKLLLGKYKDSILVSTSTGEGMEELKNKLIGLLQEEHEEPTILGDLVPHIGTVVLVVPVDSEAPKGRIILPQVQCIRDCLDHGIKSYVTRDIELKSALEDLKNVDLVVTDSQAFKEVSEVVPENIYLTSFSMLFARQKGDLSQFVKGVDSIKLLNENSKILIAESCTHNISHEDIGKVKIPRLLNNYVGHELHYDYCIHHDFPEDLKQYDLIIQCGGCMVNRKSILNRVEKCKELNVPITNYGVILAFLNGIMDRSLKVFNR